MPFPVDAPEMVGSLLAALAAVPAALRLISAVLLVSVAKVSVLGPFVHLPPEEETIFFPLKVNSK